MVLRLLLILAATAALASCTSTSDGVSFKDRPFSTQGKVQNDFDYLI